MQKVFRYIWLFLFLAIAVLASSIEIEKNDYSGFANPYYNIVYLVCFLLSIPLALSWYKNYTVHKSKTSFVIALSPLYLLVFFLIITLFHIKRKNVPAFFKAGVEGFSIELRNDSSFRIVDYGEFSTDSYYGKFHFIGDTIQLLSHKKFSSEKFLIVENTLDTVHKKGVLYLISKNGQIDSINRFTI